MTQPTPALPPAPPPEIRGWNWGAFLLNWIWGLGNNTFIALLCLVPFVNLVMPFVLGAKGNEWAWQNGRWRDVAHFRRVQRLWAFAGVAVFVAMLGVAAAGVGSFLYLFKHTEPYLMAVAHIQGSAEAKRVFGEPIEAGFPLGSINTSGSSGTAALDFSVTGPRAKGRAYVKATKGPGNWALRSLQVSVDGRAEPLDLLTETHAARVPNASAR